MSVEQEVGGSSPPNCTSRIKLICPSNVLWIGLTYFPAQMRSALRKWQSEWYCVRYLIQ